MTATKQPSNRQERAALVDLAEVVELLSTAPEPRPADPPPDPAPQEPHDALADLLLSTAAPAVGVLGASPHQLPAVVAGFTRTGVFAGREQHSATATAVQVSREPRGRYLANVTQPGRGQNWARPEVFTPSFGPGASVETLTWLRDLATGLRSQPAARDVPMLVVLDEGSFELDERVRAGLERLAIAACCVVAVVQDGPATWQSKTLEPKPLEAPMPRRREPVASEPPDPAGLLPPEWFEGIGQQVRDHPESIAAANGERVQVSYGLKDTTGRSYIGLRGHRVSDTGRLEALEVQVAPGVTVALDACRVYPRQ